MEYTNKRYIYVKCLKMYVYKTVQLGRIESSRVESIQVDAKKHSSYPIT